MLRKHADDSIARESSLHYSIQLFIVRDMPLRLIYPVTGHILQYFLAHNGLYSCVDHLSRLVPLHRSC